MIPDDWVIDSGATRHMTNDRSFFSTMDTNINSKVTLADSNKTITLKNVLYVPKLDGGLISVSQLAVKGFVVKFGVSPCEIQNAAGETKVVGNKVGNLYRLRIQKQSLKAGGGHHDRCQHTWHRRIGHRDPEALRRIEKDDLVSGFILKDCGEHIVCECCLKGKLAPKPFPPTTERKTSRLLEIIHTDLCGPMETTTPSGNRYLMTLIDDFSRYTTVYLLKSKCEAAARIKQYVRLVENQFGRKPLIIHSDGRGEYGNRELKDFYETEGIKSRYTTPYSPQQNGIAERKNRSLQEMAICMLADADMEKLFWGEAVMTATYLQNRLPSRAVNRTHLHFGQETCLALRISVRDARFIELNNGSEQSKEPSESDKTDELETTLNIPMNPPSVLDPRIDNDNNMSVGELEGWCAASDDLDGSFFRGFDKQSVVDERAEPDAADFQRQDRRTRGVLLERYNDFVVSIAELTEAEPTSYKSALQNPKWKEAMDSEMKSHDKNDTNNNNRSINLITFPADDNATVITTPMVPVDSIATQNVNLPSPSFRTTTNNYSNDIDPPPLPTSIEVQSAPSTTIADTTYLANAQTKYSTPTSMTSTADTVNIYLMLPRTNTATTISTNSTSICNTISLQSIPVTSAVCWSAASNNAVSESHGYGLTTT
ncbi:uncharacterized protein LOC131428851 [Malaya genurostris]|uniref:uncharacterized protein LOC131428851 n=1 Tax=Malaya genurostris TaxID=325434 RepID=UPI0026F39043|nr:uncharacterized protein LOC131428851 [Malaya genurostris]